MNAAQYMKNVGKSMGYIAIDSFKKMSPGIAAIYDNAKDFTSELYDTIDDFKYNITNIDNEKSVASKTKNTATEAWKNARDDFLSGNWYNQERKAAADEEFAKSMGLDLDFDMDDFLNDEPTGKSETDNFDAQSAQETQAVIGTVNGSVSAAANSMVSATVESADYLASIQNANTGIMYNLNTKGFKNINLGLNAINANLASMLTLAQPLTTHMQNSATFYAKSTELQEKSVSLLEQIVKNTSAAQQELEATRRSLYDYVNEGGVNLGALFSDAKEDIMKGVNDWKEMFTMFGGGGGDFKASPISAMLTMLFPMLVPKTTKKRLKSFSDFLEVAGFNEMNKMSRKYNNSLLGFFGDLLGFSMPSLETKLSINTAGYQKGKVDWNGKAEKALMEVIPYYLSKMTAVMTGTGEMEIFNYETGKFTTKSQLQTKYNQERKNVTDYIGWDLYDSIRETSPAAGITEEQINQLSRRLIESGRTDYAKLFSVKKQEREDFIDSVDGLREFFKNNPNLYRYLTKAANNTGSTKWGKGKNKQNIINKLTLGEYSNAIGAGFGDYKDYLERVEKSGEFNILANGGLDISEMIGGKGGGGLFGSDKNGYSALDYLRGIYINTSGGYGGRGKNANLSGAPIPGIRDYLVEPIPDPKSKSRGSKKGSEAATAEEKPKSDKEILDEYITYEYANSKMDDKAVKELIKSLKEDPSIKKYLLAKAKNDEEKDGKFQEDDAIEARIRIKVFGSRISNFATRHNFDGAIGGFFEKMTNILQYPVDIVNRTLDTIKFTIHDIIFSEKGIWGWLFDKEDGKLRPAINAIKDTIFGREVYGGGEDSTDFDPSENMNLTDLNAYNGRIVRKTGLVAVSEGEMIIPAEFNPYYHKRVNKAKQIAGETQAIKNFYGSFANGGFAGIGAGGSKGKGQTSHREGGLLGAGRNMLEKGFADFGQLLFNTFKGAVGLGDEKKQEQDKKVTENVIRDAVKGIEEHAGDAIVGGLIGGGVSLLTGSVISPLLGAAVGAGTGLLISSKRVRTFLFGDDEDSEKGLIGGDTGKKIRTFIEDQLPSTLVGGALGGVGGALLGHPVLGLFLGSGIGFATKSAAVQDYLFGAKDANGNRTGISTDGSNALISKELQDRLKKALPGMSVGAIGGIVATAMGGPFGLVGNMLIGSATGAFVTSETFKNWLLGEKDEKGKREGGFVQILRERLLDPVREIFFNVGERLRQDFRKVALDLSKVLKDAVIHFFDKGIGRFIKRGIGAAINGIGKLFGIENLKTKIPKWLTLQPLSDRLRATNFTRGNLVLDKSGRALTAAERMAEMEGLDMIVDTDNFGYRMTDMLANGNLTNDELKELRDATKGLSKAKTTEDRWDIITKNKHLNDLFAKNKGLSDSEVRKLQDAVNVELGKKTPEIIIKDLGDDVKTIAKNISNIWNFGVRINTNPVEPNIEESSPIGSALYGTTKRATGTTEFRKTDRFGGGDKTTGESSASTVAGQIERATQKEIEEKNEAFYRNLEEQTQLTEEMVDGLFGSEGSSNDKETKKNGTFGKFFGEDSFIGKAAKMVVKAGEFILTIVPIALAAFATGVFDDLLSALGIGYGKSKNTDVTDASGNTTSVSNLVQYMNTLPGSEAGVTDYEHYSVTQNDAATVSDRALGTIVRGGGAWVAIFTTNIWNGLMKLKSIPMIGEMISEAAMKKFAKEAAEECAEKAAKEAFKGTIKGALRTQVYITAAFALIDFTAGMQDAESILKVSNPSMPQRLVAGAVRAIKNITIIGALFPDSWVVDLFVKCFGDDLGLEKFEAQRKAAEEELAAYNAAKRTDYNWDQYQKGVLGNLTWTERSWSAVKEGAVNTVAAIKNPKQWMQNIKTGTVEGWKSGETFGGKLYGAIAGFQDEVLPGLLGDFTALTTRTWQHAADGDIKALWADNLPAFQGSDPISQIMSNVIMTLFNPIKIIMSPVALLMKVVNDVGYKIGNLIVGVTSGGFNYLKNEANEVERILHSDKFTGFNGLIAALKVNEPGDDVKLKPLFKGLAQTTRLLMFPIEITKTVGRIASGILTPIFNDFSQAVGATETDIEQMVQLTIDGRPSDLNSFESSVSSFNPVVSKLSDMVIGSTKTTLILPSIAICAFKIAGQKIHDFVQPYIDNIKEKIDYYKGEFSDAMEKAENGDSVEDIMGNEPLPDLNDPADIFLYSSTKIARFMALPIVGLKAVGGKIGNFIDRIKVAIKSNNIIYKASLKTIKSYADDDNKTYEDIINYDAPFDEKDPTWQIRDAILLFPRIFYGMTKAIQTPIQGLKDRLGNAFDNFKDFVNIGYDGATSGGGSGFISQRDSRYAGKSLGGYSVGDMGCGPAVASMVLGNNMNANINLARRYQTNGGTDLAYFADAFARNGRSAKYYNLAAGASGTDMVRDIASGKPVVLMGRNPYNTSKRYSPFGPNNHYVVARGFKNGGIVIDDPEMGAGGRVYNTNILNSVTAAVGAGGSGLRRLTGIGAGAATFNSITDNIWAFFRDRGYSEAATAGILANMQSESSFNTGVAGDIGLVEGGSHGLCQWNRGRWQACVDLAKSMGRDPSDLTVQLTHCDNEISNGAAGNGYKNISDPYKAGYDFCVKFEVPENKEAKGKTRGNLAIEFYNHYTGSNIPFVDNAVLSGSSSASVNRASGTKEMTPFQKLLSLPSIIGNAFSSVFSGNSNNTSGTTSSSSTSSGEILNNNVPVASWPGKQPVEYMRDVLGKLTYSKTNRDPDKGGGDCSSTVAWALTKAGLPVTTDSRWQYMNQDRKTHPDWQNVLWYDNGLRLRNRPMPVDLQPNDVLFYSWEGSNSTYPDHVDHVEMYNGDGQLIGNGGGKGTRLRPVTDLQKDIIKIVRPRDVWSSAGGSGLASNNFLKGIRQSTVTKNGKVYNINEYRQMKAAGASSIGEMDKSTALLLKSIITLIEALVKNTNDISSIYEIIAAYCSKNPGDRSAQALSEIAKNRSDDMESIESSLAGLKATVDNILAS